MEEGTVVYTLLASEPTLVKEAWHRMQGLVQMQEVIYHCALLHHPSPLIPI